MYCGPLQRTRCTETRAEGQTTQHNNNPSKNSFSHSPLWQDITFVNDLFVYHVVWILCDYECVCLREWLAILTSSLSCTVCMYICTMCVCFITGLLVQAGLTCAKAGGGSGGIGQTERTGVRETQRERGRQTERCKSYVQRINVVVLVKAIFLFPNQEVNRIICERDG